MQKSSVGLLRSLLYQIFRECPDIAPLPGRHEPLSDWTERRLLKVFQDITPNLSNLYRTCFFIDGLDEFSGDHDELITMFQELVEKANIKVVLSSRPYPMFDRALSSGAMLKLQDLTKADIREFVSDRLLSIPRVKLMAAQEPQRISESVKRHLIYQIVEKSDGVFLWVDLAVKDLIRGINNEDSLEQLQERLDNLPRRLEDLYAHMLSKIDKVERKDAAWFLQIALLKNSYRNLLDFTLAVYERLDHDLGSAADFPSQNVMDRCPSTRRRINTTCTRLLEIHGGQVNAASGLGYQYIKNPEARFEVNFLHRTVADFFTSSEEGNTFMNTNSSKDRNVHLVWAKVLVAKVRMFGFPNESTREPSWYGKRYIETIMGAASNAESKTGVAQTALCDYINRAVSIQDRKRKNSPEPHWCTRIHSWDGATLMTDQKNTFPSTGNRFKEDNNSTSISEKPIDYVGFAASYGLKIFIQQHVALLPAELRSRKAQYLLFCAISSLRFCQNHYWIIQGVLDLACMLLEYGANPNTPGLGSTVWGYLLVVMFKTRHHWSKAVGAFWRIAVKCFIDHGADTNGTLSRRKFHTLKIKRHNLHALAIDLPDLGDRSEYRTKCFIGIEVSVPTVIRFCLCASPAATDILSSCMPNGALLNSKITEMTVQIEEPISSREVPPKVIKRWALSQQQSDRLLEAFHGLIRPDPPDQLLGAFQGNPPNELSWKVWDSANDNLKRQILLLYSELSGEPYEDSNNDGTSSQDSYRNRRREAGIFLRQPQSQHCKGNTATA